MLQKNALKLVTPPAVEPVSVDEMKDFLRIDGSADDDMLEAFIMAARTLVESYLHRALITQTWDFALDGFPSQRSFDQLPEGVTDGALSEFLRVQSFIDIPIFPLQSVTSLNTYGDNGVAVLMPDSDYIVDIMSEPGRLSLKTTTSWPTTVLRPVNGIIIRFNAGYGASGTSVPSAILQAIKMLTAQFYSQRGCDSAGADGSGWPKPALALLGPYRVYRV